MLHDTAFGVNLVENDILNEIENDIEGNTTMPSNHKNSYLLTPNSENDIIHQIERDDESISIINTSQNETIL